ncbi:MAG: MTH938/NDUFAF3 family protein [Candidatus Krumholzibacteriaceae bacterium]|jgi:hypothetical protein
MNAPEGKLLIEKYAFGSMRLGDRTYYNDLTISAGEVARWWRESSHLVQSADIDVTLAVKPDVLVIGTGYSGGMSVSDEAKRLCADGGVELVVERTARAVERYNALVLEGIRSVAAAFHLTC